MPNTSISFRALGRPDFALLERWTREPHVEAWWHEPHDLAAIEAKYGPRIDGADPTHVYLIEYGGQAVGWIQWYRWADYPDHAAQLGAEPDSAGIDLAIGEKEMTGMGLGARAIGKFLTQVVFVDPALRAIVTDPEETNLRSVRALEKAGFQVVRTVKLRGEDFQRCVMRLARAQRTSADGASLTGTQPL